MHNTDNLEAGEKYTLKIEGLTYDIQLPFVRLQSGDSLLKIASFNLVGQVRLNHDLGLMLAKKIADVVPALEGAVILTAVEKALQLTQVAAQALGMDAVAVAYNRVKPHMEQESRPVVRIGSDSITSGAKFLAIYERDMNLLAQAKSVILIDDVVSTGGTISGLFDILEEVARHKGLSPLPVAGVFCIAVEGRTPTFLPAPVYSLATLPEPEAE